MPGGASPLQSSVLIRQSGPVLVLSGEADMHATAELREVLIAQLWRGERRLVIDVAGLRHVDSESVRVLVVAAKMLREQDGELVLLHPQPGVARMLELMGADQVITTAEPPETLTALVRPRRPAHQAPHDVSVPQQHDRRPQVPSSPAIARSRGDPAGRGRPLSERRRAHLPPWACGRGPPGPALAGRSRGLDTRPCRNPPGHPGNPMPGGSGLRTTG